MDLCCIVVTDDSKSSVLCGSHTNMASSRPSRTRNPTTKASADVNRDFASLLPFQQHQAIEAATTRNNPAEASSAPPLSSNVPPSPTANADNGRSQELSSDPIQTSRSTSNHPPSPSTPVPDDGVIGRDHGQI